MSSLLDLLEEPDANLRAVAAISLSKVGQGHQEVWRDASIQFNSNTSQLDLPYINEMTSYNARFTV